MSDGQTGRSLFHLPWFSGLVFSGIHEAMHGSEKKAEAIEGSFMSQLVLELLERQRSGTLFNKGLYDFFSFCQTRLEDSHSQILQDLWVLYMLKEKRGGYFVEFGACDGRKLSNTLLLETKYDWTGILAEPNPVWHDELNRNRICHISTDCVSDRSGERIAFEHVPGQPELSRMQSIAPDDVHEHNGNRSTRETIEVNTISLVDLLKKYSAPSYIDYLSVDTEGSEFHILNAFDFSAYKFGLISVEHAGETEKREQIRSLLERHGYRRWRPELSRWDDWYYGLNS